MATPMTARELRCQLRAIVIVLDGADRYEANLYEVEANQYEVDEFFG